MRIRYADFDPEGFSFHDEPVLVLDDFWSGRERAGFREAMAEAPRWTALSEMPDTHRTFRDCGNWIKAEIAGDDRDYLIKRTLMPCIVDYIESFSNIRQRVMSFNYFSYAAGDCLSVHDDSADVDSGERPGLLRRIALATYFHETWDVNWGGELITYETSGDGETLQASHCIDPRPGSLVLFTVPRVHRVCRVDPHAGSHRRLSIAGWFMTEH